MTLTAALLFVGDRACRLRLAGRPRGIGLTQWMRADEGIKLHTRGENAPCHWVGLDIQPTQHFSAGEMGDEADIRDSHLITVAIAPGARVAREHGLDSVARGCEPMREPRVARRLRKPELVLEILAHARHNEGMCIHGDHLGERAHPRPGIGIGRQ